MDIGQQHLESAFTLPGKETLEMWPLLRLKGQSSTIELQTALRKMFFRSANW